MSTHIPQTGDNTFPPGTKFEVPPSKVPNGWIVTVDPNTGDITVTPPANAVPGSIVNIPIMVTYPDGTSEEVNVEVVVAGDSAAQDSDTSSQADVQTKQMSFNSVEQTANAMHDSKDNVSRNSDMVKDMSNDMNKDEASKAKVLPDTGEQPIENTTLFGSLFAGLGSLFLFGRRKDEKEENE